METVATEITGVIVAACEPKIAADVKVAVVSCGQCENFAGQAVSGTVVIITQFVSGGAAGIENIVATRECLQDSVGTHVAADDDRVE